VPLATPVMRHVARIELPSTRAETTRTRVAVSREFILTNMLDRPSIVKGDIEQEPAVGGDQRAFVGSLVRMSRRQAPRRRTYWVAWSLWLATMGVMCYKKPEPGPSKGGLTHDVLAIVLRFKKASR
jgi:hypothetical protein